MTIWEELKYGAIRRLAPNSTAITDMPAKNSVAIRKYLCLINFDSKRVPFLIRNFIHTRYRLK